MLLSGPMNGDMLRAYVRHVLVRELSPADTVIISRMPAHNIVGILEMIEAAEARSLYLPPYSPDFNPISEAPKSWQQNSVSDHPELI